MVCSIMSLVIDAVWYSFIGYRVGDADGTGKLVYLVRQLRSRLNERRHRRKPRLAAASVVPADGTRNPDTE